MTVTVEGPDALSTFADLLAATDCADAESLSDLVDGDCEPDVWVAELDDGVEVGSGTHATGLLFPFTVGEFWEVVEEVEQEETARIENSSEQEDDAGVSTGTLGGNDRISVWSRMGREKLVETAQRYHAVITYSELAQHVQETSGLHTGQLMRYWIGKVLFRIAEDCGRRDEPMLTALCVTQNGAVGGGYAGAVRSVYGYEPDQPDDHAAEQRFQCYRHFGADLPADGGRPAVTTQVQARRDKQRPTGQIARRGDVCPTCFTETPVSGNCAFCQ